MILLPVVSCRTAWPRPRHGVDVAVETEEAWRGGSAVCAAFVLVEALAAGAPALTATFASKLSRDMHREALIACILDLTAGVYRWNAANTQYPIPTARGINIEESGGGVNGSVGDPPRCVAGLLVAVHQRERKVAARSILGALHHP